MLSRLFSSKARVAILKLFLFNSKNSFYLRQISVLAEQPVQAVQREVKKLEELGIIEKTISGKNVFFKINEACPIYHELKSIFMKTEGIAERLKEELEKRSNIKIAFIYGSYAQGEEGKASDIDIFVIGTIKSRVVSSLLSKEKEELGRDINYIVMSSDEFVNKIKEKNHFILSILKEKKIFIIGDNDELKKLS